MYFLQQLINGICQGSIYALVAIGYTLIVGITGLVSFCYGETVMVGAFLSWLAMSYLGDSPVLAILVALFGTAIVGAIIHKICYERFFDAPRHISLMCTIGMGILLKSLAQIVTRSETKPIAKLFGNGYIDIGAIRISYVQIAVLSIVIVASIALSIFMNKTKVGIMLKAVSQDKKAAALVDINVSKATMLGNMLGCGMGGVSGILYAVYYTSFKATMGNAIGMKAFSSSALGGLSDVAVSAIGGLNIGIFENIGISIFGSSYRDLIAFVFLILVLVIKPTGLSFGSKGGRKK